MVLFHDDADRLRFLAIVALVLKETGTKCLAWALMSNHYHLVLVAGPAGISKVIQRINLTYAKYYNRRYGGTGHVFQGRFGSKLVTDDDHLLTVIGYVHLNPVRARVVATVDDLADHPWSGHAALMGRQPPGFLAANRTLNLFALAVPQARIRLRNFLMGLAGEVTDLVDDVAQHRLQSLALTQRDRLRTDLAGVASIEGPLQRAADILRPRAARLAWRRLLEDRGWTLDRLIETVCRAVGADPDAVRVGRRTAPEARARAVIGFLGFRYLEISGRRLAAATGVTCSAMSRATSRGKSVLDRNGLSADALFDAPVPV